MSANSELEMVEMQDEKSKVSSAKSKKPKDPQESKKTKDSGVKKLDPQSVKILAALSAKANRKDYGQKIRDSEIIHAGLLKLTDEDIEFLQEKSIRGKDRQTLAFEKYCKENGKITLDEYLNKVFSGEIKLGV